MSNFLHLIVNFYNKMNISNKTNLDYDLKYHKINYFLIYKQFNMFIDKKSQKQIKIKIRIESLKLKGIGLILILLNIKILFYCNLLLVKNLMFIN